LDENWKLTVTKWLSFHKNNDFITQMLPENVKNLTWILPGVILYILSVFSYVSYVYWERQNNFKHQSCLNKLYCKITNAFLTNEIVELISRSQGHFRRSLADSIIVWTNSNNNTKIVDCFPNKFLSTYLEIQTPRPAECKCHVFYLVQIHE
jgi:hypothetical protein